MRACATKVCLFYRPMSTSMYLCFGEGSPRVSPALSVDLPGKLFENVKGPCLKNYQSLSIQLPKIVRAMFNR